jgi:hypothetical protein
MRENRAPEGDSHRFSRTYAMIAWFLIEQMIWVLVVDMAH